MRTNSERATAVSATLDYYAKASGNTGDDAAEALIDLFTDLRHAFSTSTFDAALRISLSHYLADELAALLNEVNQ